MSGLGHRERGVRARRPPACYRTRTGAVDGDQTRAERMVGAEKCGALGFLQATRLDSLDIGVLVRLGKMELGGLRLLGAEVRVPRGLSEGGDSTRQLLGSLGVSLA